MANWISSKLKVAETFLQQIDQQAAEQLGKNENPRSEDLNAKVPKKTESSSAVPLKDQFKKIHTNNIQNESNSGSDDTSREVGRKLSSNVVVRSPPKTLTDTDWTELLSTPKQPSPATANRTNGVSAIREQLKEARKSVEVKKKQRSLGSFPKAIQQKSDIALKSRVNGAIPNRKHSDAEESSSGDSVRSEIRNNDGNVEKIENLGERESVESTVTGASVENAEVSGKVNGISETKKQVGGDSDGFGGDDSHAASRSSVAQELHRGTSLSSDGTSASESDSTSTTDSEKENERKAERARRREHIMAEKAAAKAVEVIKERENIVARLEGEKQSLEKILEERAKQQAQEASQLQTSMMETMDAVDLEKQKHNTTRMEALTRLTKLETSNADLAKSLAARQWNLEIEVTRVAELRQQIESKEAVQEELRKRISQICQSGSSSNEVEASKGIEFEREILDAEYLFTCDKIGRLQDKARKLEENIEMTRKEIEEPTEVEAELKRRLAQLTDHLIQKQAQVESLASEKATLLFRIETVSRMLEEQKSMPQMSDIPTSSSRQDLEIGGWGGMPDSKPNLHSFTDRVRLGSGSLVRQLDAIFSAGAAFLRRNTSAKFMSAGYLVSDTKSGAVISLENINKTTATF